MTSTGCRFFCGVSDARGRSGPARCRLTDIQPPIVDDGYFCASLKSVVERVGDCVVCS